MNPRLPEPVITAMAAREYRMHHLLWHEIRRYWLQYPRDLQEKIRELGWEPPRPARDENESPLLHNDSGQDFLYLHRQLNQRVNRILTQVGDPDYPQVEGWERIPPPGDPDFPVPEAWYDPGDLPIRNRYLVRIKSDIVYDKHLRYWEKTFSNPVFLRAVSIGELGAMIDFYLVDPVRRRWAAAPGATRPQTGPAESEAIATDWDHPGYDYLGDYYSMHVNPVYWRFFGWVDDRVEEWKAANGVFGNDFWTGTWVGKLPEIQPAAPAAATGTTAGPAGAEGEQPRDEQAAAAAMAEMAELVNAIAASGAATSLRSEDLRLIEALEPAGGTVEGRPLVGAGGHH